MRKLSYLFIALGILVILFPKANEWNEDRKQSELLKEAEVLNPSIIDGYKRLSSKLAENTGIETTRGPSVPANETDPRQLPIATISINRIDLKLPVLEGATRDNMKHASVHMSETAALGQTGNAAIAAHRARTAGRLFNRLNEVKIGDKIIINTKGEQYSYTVYKISIVAPTDVSVLKSFENQKLLTLITCDPLVNPTHRLIVQARQST
ncbi:class D sortase [Paenibacillus terrae]|uniref:Sortase n=1 Tax=Paenibacillus terrae TaxID=159743 RepID=A0A0D7WYB4_9BACL|nr:class D sortase [Paenibacillus terrae]KJD43954.1 sortase [Paenibacillus terrae]